MANDFLKVLPFFPMALPNATPALAESATHTMTYFDWLNADVLTNMSTASSGYLAVDVNETRRFYSSYKQHLVLNTLRNFTKDLRRLKSFVEGYEINARTAFSRAIIEIDALNPTNIICGLTDSKSIYFRIYHKNNFETHLEVFYLIDEDDDVEAVSTIYKNDQVVLKTFGAFHHVLNGIRKVTSPSEKMVNLAEYAALSI